MPTEFVASIISSKVCLFTCIRIQQIVLYKALNSAKEIA